MLRLENKVEAEIKQNKNLWTEKQMMTSTKTILKFFCKEWKSFDYTKVGVSMPLVSKYKEKV